MNWAAVIPAAGRGQRFESTGPSKQFRQVLDRPLLIHTVACFVDEAAFSMIIIPVAPEYVDSFLDQFIKPHFPEAIDRFQVVAGGDTRAHSVYNGVKAAAAADFVAIHDAARPCLSHQLLRRLMQTTEEKGNAVPGYPIYDTVKKATDRQIVGATIDRSQLWLVQTPQCFSKEVIEDAYGRAIADQVTLTDDASAVEYVGGSVYLVAGDVKNIKVTYASDLDIAKDYIEGRDVQDRHRLRLSPF